MTTLMTVQSMSNEQKGGPARPGTDGAGRVPNGPGAALRRAGRGGSASLGTALLLVLCAPLTLSAQSHTEGASEAVSSAMKAPAAARALRATPAAVAPAIDGLLNEAVWGDAPVASGFVQFRPRAGEPATERTEVRVLYVPGAIYVAARLHDTRPDGIIRRLARRDERTVSDAFRVGIDSYFDRRTAFVFEVNASGVQRDWLQYDDTRQDAAWDAVWESAVSSDAGGWVVEMRIPVSQLRFERQDGDGGELTWGINFERQIARLDETSTWSPRPADGSRDVSAFGTLTGLTDLRAGRSLEVRPYLVARGTRAPGAPGDPFHRATDLASTAGADARYGLSSNLTLNVTLNPDFGQVEADPASVNLSAFETFVAEKRPFFQEGSDIFQFGLGGDGRGGEQLFYSRRIGRAPQGRGPTEPVYTDVPDATTILGAAKLSGKTASGWSFGLLHAITGEESARYVGAGGIEGRMLVEPVTNYSAGRAIRNFREGESAVGLVFTSVQRAIEEGGPVETLSSSALAGGLDVRHRFGDGRHEVTGFLLGSRVSGGAAAIARLQRSSTHYYQRADASHVRYNEDRTELVGTAAAVELARIAGGPWRWQLSGRLRSPGFDVNALGFQRRADQVAAGGSIGYESFGGRGLVRRWSLDVESASEWTFGGERTELEFGVGGSLQFANFWGGYGGVRLRGPAVSPTALRGGPALRTPAGVRGFWGVRSDGRRRLSVGLGGGFDVESGTGSRSLRLSPSVGFRSSSRLDIELQPSLAWNRDGAQYVTQRSAGGERRYIFGRLDQTTASLTARLNYTFHPDLSVQLYAQPFVSAGRYDRFASVRDARAADFDDRFAILGPGELSPLGSPGAVTGYAVDTDRDGAADFTFANPAFNTRQFRSNLVVRWQYRPGSTLFLVWSQGRRDFDRSGDLRAGRDLDALFASPATNVFLIKFEHWLGF